MILNSFKWKVSQFLEAWRLLKTGVRPKSWIKNALKAQFFDINQLKKTLYSPLPYLLLSTIWNLSRQALKSRVSGCLTLTTFKKSSSLTFLANSYWVTLSESGKNFDNRFACLYIFWPFHASGLVVKFDFKVLKTRCQFLTGLFGIDVCKMQ